MENLSDKMIEWLRKNKEFLSIRAIEKKLGMKDTLQKAVNGSQALPEKWEQPLKEFITKLKED